MKNLLLLTIMFFSLATFSQQCTNDSLTLYPSGDINYVQQGFIDPNILPCMVSGQYSELVIPYRTFNQGVRLLTLRDSTTVPVPHIYSIRVDAITNLPSGLCWTTKQNSNPITGDQLGVLIIKGTTSALAGTTHLCVKLSLDLQGSGTFTYTNLDNWNYRDLLGQVILKVMDSSGNCPDVN